MINDRQTVHTRTPLEFDLTQFRWNTVYYRLLWSVQLDFYPVAMLSTKTKFFDVYTNICRV